MLAMPKKTQGHALTWGVKYALEVSGPPTIDFKFNSNIKLKHRLDSILQSNINMRLREKSYKLYLIQLIYRLQTCEG